ncbi:MAG: patatin-like phospholipase family protein [Polyangiaceae bacterium]|nr:patatin-like phospholipase family protein [Polyangiaceae bacterium]
MTSPRIALCLTGGGLTGAMYQIAALAALEDAVDGFSASGCAAYVGVGAGAPIAAALAGGASVQRLYRTFLDPADDYFPLQRGHLLKMDLDEWRRTITSALSAIRAGALALASRPPERGDLLEQLDRFNDSLPAGVFTLDAFEHLLEEAFFRRDVPNQFRAMPRALRVPAYDLDSGERVVFGAPGAPDVPVARACAASMATPPFYSPVRIGDRHYLSGSVGAVAHVDVALAEGVDAVIVVNPLVTIRAPGAVPTGHGPRHSLRDKGLIWIHEQASRIAAARRFDERLGLLGEAASRIVVIAPRPEETPLFLNHPGSARSRRGLLEAVYRGTRARLPETLSSAPAVASLLPLSSREAPR